MVYFTFDDGPGPTTERILGILEKYNIKATFFISGDNLKNSPWSSIDERGWEVGKIILRNGHLLGNHTFSHQKVYKSEHDFLSEIEVVDSLIYKLYSDTNISPQAIPVRLPFGLQNNDLRINYLAGIGRLHMHWTANFNDWHEGANSKLAENIIYHIQQRELTGLNSVLDLHDGGIGNSNGYNRDATADAVEEVINEAKKRNWPFALPR